MPFHRMRMPCALGLLGAALLGGPAAAQSPPLLSPPTFVVPSGQPFALGDVGGDGHLDLVLNDFASKLEVRAGDGLGGFLQPVVTSVSPAKIDRVAVGDVDGDGHADVAFGVKNNPTVQVRLGAADGSFGAPLDLPLTQAGVVQHVALCDATGDGALDLVASQQFSSRLTVYVGTGDGGFATPPHEVLGIPALYEVQAGEIDGDGRTDLVLYSGLLNNEILAILFGHGDGSFEPPLFVDTNLDANVALGDLDGDGRDDIAPVRLGGSTQDAFATWQPGVGLVAIPLATVSPAAFCVRAFIGDLDRDGIGELLLATSSNIFEIYRRDEGSPFAFIGRTAFGSTGGRTYLADIDSDGGVDLISGVGGITLLAGQGDGGFHPLYGFVWIPRDVAVGDLTGDGRPDVVAVFGEGHSAELLRGRLDGRLGPPELFDAGPAPEQVWLLDATGDGLPDVLASGGAAVAVAAGHADGSFDPPLITMVPEEIIEAAVAPFGGDALPDLAVLVEDPGLHTGRVVHILVNAGGTFTDTDSMTVASPATHAVALQAADVDGDLDTDLVSHWDGDFLRVYLKQPAGFEPSTILAIDGERFLATDLDADGDVDLAVPVYNDLFVFLGDGSGSFSGPTEYGFDRPVNVPTLADVDGDGHGDLVVPYDGGVSINPHSFEVGLGHGDGSFGPFTAWPAGAGGRIAKVADMNGDAQADVVVVLNGAKLALVEAQGPWTKRGHSLAGAAGFSRLQGFGPLTPGSAATVRISNGKPGSPALLIAGLNEIVAPFKGGVLVPHPTLIVPLGVLDGDGRLQVSGLWPATMPHDASYSLQVWRAEPGAPNGFGATTAIRGTAP